MNIIYKVVRIQDNKYYSAFASRKNIPILEYPLRKWVATPKSFKKYNYLIMAFQQLADAHFFINNNFFIAQDTLVIFDAIYQGKIRTKRVRLLDGRGGILFIKCLCISSSYYANWNYYGRANQTVEKINTLIQNMSHFEIIDQKIDFTQLARKAPYLL